MVLGVGYGNFVAADKIVAIVSPESAPIKRLVRDSRKESRLIDATAGHKTRSVIILTNDQVLISANLPKTLVEKIGGAVS